MTARRYDFQQAKTRIRSFVMATGCTQARDKGLSIPASEPAFFGTIRVVQFVKARPSPLAKVRASLRRAELVLFGSQFLQASIVERRDQAAAA